MLSFIVRKSKRKPQRTLQQILRKPVLYGPEPVTNFAILRYFATAAKVSQPIDPTTTAPSPVPEPSLEKRLLDAAKSDAIEDVLALAEYLVEDDRRDEAMEIVQKKAKEGDAQAMMYLAKLFLRDEEPDYNLVEYWAKLAADYQLIEAMELLGDMYSTDELGMIDIDLAIKYLSSAVEGMSINACNMLGKIYMDKGDFKAAEKYYKIGADADDINCCRNLGLLYYYILLEYEKAEQYLTLAAKENDPKAQLALGRMCIDEDLGINDIDESIRWLTLAAEQEDIEAMLCLGVIFKSQEKAEDAKEWFAEAARSGSISALFHLGDILYDSKDYDGAIEIWKVAAEEGDQDSIMRLGGAYLSEDYEKRSFEDSEYWLLIASQKNLNALLTVCLLYLGEYFDEKDLNKAKATIAKLELVVQNDEVKHLIPQLKEKLKNCV
eukprot:TRINITY_DN1994_c1_g1_i3.p1 TRINITY_DN1994_c1_g1~~TRINITY_DN1994_c1_g1_i3.p1  ORF type:complete len:436 (+),score=114.93 TRINITY_DN1994_c1_g1_i3:27-1334(+)